MTDKVKINREEELTLPTGERMMVDVGDWARIRKNVERLGEPLVDRASTFAAILAGAAVTLLGVIVSVHVGETDPSQGLSAGLWVAFGFCTFFAFVFAFMGSAEKKRYHVSNKSICDDMDDLATRAGQEGLGVPKGADQSRRRFGRRPRSVA